jgi:hypothetical protein
MHRNPIWLLLIGVVLVITLFYAGRSAVSVSNYYAHSGATTSETVLWEAIEVNSDKYVVEGSYSFVVDGQQISGKTRLDRPVFRNRWAAEDHIQQLGPEGPWRVWYVPSDPNRSSLQKRFPTKECVSTAALSAILIYFLGLGYYVSRQHSN